MSVGEVVGRVCVAARAVEREREGRAAIEGPLVLEAHYTDTDNHARCRTPTEKSLIFTFLASGE